MWIVEGMRYRQTDRQTNLPTNGHSQLKRCFVAPKKQGGEEGGEKSEEKRGKNKPDRATMRPDCVTACIALVTYMVGWIVFIERFHDNHYHNVRIDLVVFH